MISAAIVIAVAVAGGYSQLIWLVAFLGTFRMFQDYVLWPALASRGMELHPLMVIFGVFAGGELGGIPGVFLAVPTLALLQMFYHRFRTRA
jgi:predicted PurR-regulated permease PerM